MEFEWDEAKRHSDLAKHGIDFRAVRRLFDGRPAMTEPSAQAGEERHLTTGMIGAICVTVIWTKRGEAIRLI